MSDLQSIEQPSWGGVASTPAERNKVMRNTYWLLALSLLPTVLGAWLGVSTDLFAPRTRNLDPNMDIFRNDS